MSAQGNHEIQLLHVMQDLHQSAEQRRQRQRTRMVRDEHKHLLARELPCKAPLQTLTYGLSGECSFISDRPQVHADAYTPLNAEKPPSTGTTIPVTSAEAGETSHSTVPSRSSGFWKRRMGVCAMIA